MDVYGLEDEVIERIKNSFTVKSPRSITTYNLNTASRDELVLIKYIDYEIANNIIEERTLREGFNSLDDLTKVEDFPINKIEIIKLYLHL
jgi:DNA uptake protein ComE-like DNA-binding protein